MDNGQGLTVLLSGMVAGVPRHGGAAWAVLQYALGLRRLGHRVVLVEPVEQSALQPGGGALEGSSNAAYFRQVMEAFGFLGDAAMLLAGTARTVGLDYDELRRRAETADLAINISGMLRDRELLDAAPIRVYLDLDPAFNQLWHEAEGIDVGFSGHTHFVTVAAAIGEPGCLVPDCGMDWISTLPPVVLEHWPAAECTPRRPFTTVANWRGYGSVEHAGLFFGQKAHSLRALVEAPRLTSERFLLALGIHPDERSDIQSLEQNGWELVDPDVVAGAPEDYAEFVRSSKGEVCIAKSGYVVSGSGWFSDRSACYLASARPVMAQETGFTRFLPVGEGLLPFESADDLARCAEEFGRNYSHHARAARALAEAHFDSDKVLARLLEAVSGPA